jgi:hypothetical protein
METAREETVRLLDQASAAMRELAEGTYGLDAEREVVRLMHG